MSIPQTTQSSIFNCIRTGNWNNPVMHHKPSCGMLLEFCKSIQESNCYTYIYYAFILYRLSVFILIHNFPIIWRIFDLLRVFIWYIWCNFLRVYFHQQTTTTTTPLWVDTACVSRTGLKSYFVVSYPTAPLYQWCQLLSAIWRNADTNGTSDSLVTFPINYLVSVGGGRVPTVWLKNNAVLCNLMSLSIQGCWLQLELHQNIVMSQLCRHKHELADMWWRQW